MKKHTFKSIARSVASSWNLSVTERRVLHAYFRGAQRSMDFDALSDRVKAAVDDITAWCRNFHIAY